MAKATLIKRGDEDSPYLNLCLTREEAITLRHLVAAVGGSPSTTYRKYTDSISLTLQNIGINDVVSWDSRFADECIFAKEIK